MVIHQRKSGPIRGPFRGQLRKWSFSAGIPVWPCSRNLPVPERKSCYICPHGLAPCGRCYTRLPLAIAAWAPLPAILHFDPPVRQLLNTEIKTKNENYHSKQLLSPFDRARHSGGIRRNYCDSFIGGRLCDSYKRHKQDHGERSMGTDHGFEADMPYPPLSPEQPLETGEDRDPLHAAIVQLPPVQARRVHAYYILSVSKKIARVEGVGISRVC